MIKKDKAKKQTKAIVDSMPSTLRISSEELPEIKNWKIGKKYKLEVEVEMVSVRKPDYWEINEMDVDKNELNAGFEINAIKVI